MLEVIGACYATLDVGIAPLLSKGSNEDVLKRCFDSPIGGVSKREIMDANPTMSKITLSAYPRSSRTSIS